LEPVTKNRKVDRLEAAAKMTDMLTNLQRSCEHEVKRENEQSSSLIEISSEEPEDKQKEIIILY